MKAEELKPNDTFWRDDDFRCFLRLVGEIKEIIGVKYIPVKPLSPTANEEAGYILADEEVTLYKSAPASLLVT